MDSIWQLLLLGHRNRVISWILGIVHLRYRVARGRTENVGFGDEEKADPGKGLEDVLEPVKGLVRCVVKVCEREVGGALGDRQNDPEEHGEHDSSYPGDEILGTG